MEIVININATSAEDYRNAIKALMDGAGLVGFEIPDDIPGNITPVVQPPVMAANRPGSISERQQAAKAAQRATVEAPVPSTGEMPIEAQKPAEKPAAAKTVTIDEVQTLGRKMALAGKMDRVAAVLKKYGAERLTAIPAEQLANAYADLEAANNE